MDTTHLNEASLKFTIQYSSSQLKRNNLSIIVSYTNFNMKGLYLISKIIIHLKQRKKRS